MTKRGFVPPVTCPVIDSIFESRTLKANVPIVVELSDEITFRLPVPVFMWQGSVGYVLVTTAQRESTVAGIDWLAIRARACTRVRIADYTAYAADVAGIADGRCRH